MESNTQSSSGGGINRMKYHLAGIRGNIAACKKSPYFQSALDAISMIGRGYKGPSYNDMRIHLLANCKKECQLLIDGYRSNWVNSGCTIMGDDIVKDATNLCNLFAEIVEWIGPSNVVHLVTDNASNYMKAGKLLQERYEHIYWSPCAAHCLNLLLKDIGKMPHVVELANRASKVTIFVYNHIFLLSWLRKIDGWKEIVRPRVTRFATVVITLKSIHDHKHELQALVISKHYRDNKLSKSATRKAVNDIILDNKFRDDCLLMVKIATPIIKLLCIVDGDETPSLGYVYEGMTRIRKGIMATLGNKKKFYTPYINIIDNFRYGDEPFIDTPEIVHGLLNVIEKTSMCKEPSDSGKVMDEISMYRERKESFGHRHHHKKRCYDPIDYEHIDEVDFWVMEKEESSPPKLDYDEITEEAIYVNDSIPILDYDYIQDDIVDQEVNLESFVEVGNASNDSQDWPLGGAPNNDNRGMDPSL
ncbi:uncharacterized protein LOC120256474 [Dioscorea cayenensis subsp. rotundata]|uniref:Uncharacterized protein LOC120256474 n=1 Tax=Dioscorea cayennensis subsp. rotundata TaxID=55577 RepID=A0AB40AYG1_DIOCR|nr:uncharacterized protein LOC120256474 [Dioscorea cayenensis subsp. rotundata]